MSGGYTWDVFDSVAEVPEEAWSEAQDGRVDFFMGLPLLRVLEEALGELYPVHPVLIRDDEGRAAAATVFSVIRVDSLILASPGFRRAIHWFPEWSRRPFFLPLAVCGIPVSYQGHAVRVREGADRRASLEAICRALDELGRRHRSWIQVFKEFPEGDRAEMDGLVELGYLRAEIPPDNVFPPDFADMDQFFGRLRSRYRRQIRRSMRLFQEGGLRIEVCPGGERAAELYSDEVHRLHETVRSHSGHVFEELPAGFFRALTRAFPEQTHFTFAYREERIVGFIFGVSHGDHYYNLFCGHDMALNPGTHLYFNLMYADTDHALRRAPKVLQMGSLAEVFKSRIGCRQVPMCVYLRARLGWVDWLMKRLQGWFFTSFEVLPPRNLFRDSSDDPGS